jgi:hypothetical protein
MDTERELSTASPISRALQIPPALDAVRALVATDERLLVPPDTIAQIPAADPALASSTGVASP